MSFYKFGQNIKKEISLEHIYKKSLTRFAILNIK